MIRLRTPLIAALAALLLLAGCGGDDDPSADEGTGDSTSTTAEASEDGAGTDASTPDEADDAEVGGASAEPVPSEGCGTAPHAAVTKEQHDVAAGGPDRFYLLTSPDDADPLPLVVDIHGFLEGAEVHSQQSALGEYGIEQGFATAFPHGSGDPLSWQLEPGSTDLEYIDAVVEDATATLCVDTSRIYATGLSMGAMMTSLLACERADTFAAFAPVNGLRMYEGCDPSRPVPMLTFHGTADPILLFNGGVDTSSFSGGEQGASATIPEADLDGEGYPATAEEWAELQACTDPVDVDEPPVVDRTWTCPEGAAMEFVIIPDQGHGWPGSAFAEQIASITGPQVAGVDANERIWEFFQGYSLPA